jgi:hypothetical protein
MIFCGPTTTGAKCLPCSHLRKKSLPKQHLGYRQYLLDLSWSLCFRYAQPRLPNTFLRFQSLRWPRRSLNALISRNCIIVDENGIIEASRCVETLIAWGSPKQASRVLAKNGRGRLIQCEILIWVQVFHVFIYTGLVLILSVCWISFATDVLFRGVCLLFCVTFISFFVNLCITIGTLISKKLFFSIHETPFLGPGGSLWTHVIKWL